MLRGGIGRFYDFPYTNATMLFPAVSSQSNFGSIYSAFNPAGIRNADGTLYRVGQPLPPGAGGAPDPATQVASPTQATPYSDQISLGYSWQVNDHLGLTADAIWAEYRDIPYRFRFNSLLNAAGTPTTTRRFPFAANARMWMGDGEAEYKGINLAFRYRQTRFELQGFYTLSEAQGNVLAGADEFRLGDGNFQSDYQTDRTVNSRNPKCEACIGPLYTDARHRVTFGGIYTAPWDIKVAGFFRYRSALPYNELHPLTPLDVNGDGFSGELAPGVSHVNTGRGASFSQLDVRLSKDFIFGPATSASRSSPRCSTSSTRTTRRRSTASASRTPSPATRCKASSAWCSSARASTSSARAGFSLRREGAPASRRPFHCCHCVHHGVRGIIGCRWPSTTRRRR